MERLLRVLSSAQQNIFTLNNISSLYDAMIEGFEEDEEQIKKVMSIVYDDFGLKEIKLKKLLSCTLELVDKDILKLWDAVYKWNIDVDKMKSYFVQYLYKNKKYKLRSREDKYTSFIALLKGTCINENEKEKCNHCDKAAGNGRTRTRS